MATAEASIELVERLSGIEALNVFNSWFLSKTEDSAAGQANLACPAVLKRQKNLVWFPEMYRSPTGKLQPFKPGIGMLLDHFPVPVVPVFIRGTHEAMLPGRVWVRPK